MQAYAQTKKSSPLLSLTDIYFHYLNQIIKTRIGRLYSAAESSEGAAGFAC